MGYQEDRDRGPANVVSKADAPTITSAGSVAPDTISSSKDGSTPKEKEAPAEETVENAAKAGVEGHAATDHYGHSLVTFDPKAEKKLCRKIDLFIVPTVSLLYLFCFIDRASIGNAKLAGLENDLNMAGYDYNEALSIFYISYTLFEIPCNMACKWLGPGWFLPATTLAFGITSVGTAFVPDLPSLCGVRFLLGVFEAGMLPGIAYYLSRWYRRSELTFRLSLYIVMAPLAGAFGGLLASGILNLSHVGSLTRWKMIFAVEGIITCGLGLIGFITLTDRPATARWLTEEEKELAVARVKSERVGTTEVLDKLDKQKLVRGIFSPLTMFTSFIFLLNNITVQGMAFFLPTIIKTIYPDRTVVIQQLYTVPPYIVGAFFTVLLPYLSWKFDRRILFMILSSPLTMAGYVMFLGSTNLQVRYGGTFLIASGAFSYGALCSAHVSANVVSDTARSAAIATNAMMGCVGGLISTWSYPPFDGPDYPIGNGLNLGTSSTILISAVVMRMWMVWDNKRRERMDVDSELAGLSQKQVQDLDWRHPAFRWRF